MLYRLIYPENKLKKRCREFAEEEWLDWTHPKEANEQHPL